MKPPKKEKEKVYGPEYMTHYVEVAGLVNHPQRLSVEDLCKLGLTEAKDVTMICSSGRTNGVRSNYRGVLLSRVIEHADAVMRKHDSPSWMYVTVTSSDGHWALLSYQEIFNTPVGEQALVIVEKDGLPLNEFEGEIAFISGYDLRPGSRKMRYLQKIEVHEHHPSFGN
jgi:hypothetical protein